MMQYNSSKKIITGKPENIHYESWKDFDNSIFSDVYRKAIRMVQEIITGSNQNATDEINRGTEIRNSNQISNIIFFAGERGTGKTSAMLSIAEHLKDHYRIIRKCNGVSDDYLISDDSRKDIMFTGLGHIDASIMENKEDILGLVLSQMLNKLQYEEHNNSFGRGIIRGNDFNYKKKQLIMQFNRVYMYMRELHSKADMLDKEDDQFLDAIEKFPMSWNLNSAMQGLVDQYLDIMKYPNLNGEEQEYRSYLVISIDDIDMNISHGYEMMEQIHKYLMLPKVIILMSINYEQMRKVYKEHFIRELDKTLAYEKDTEFLSDLVQEYMEKAIPEHRKIYMPTMEEITETGVTVDCTDGNDNNLNIRQFIMQQLYRKFRLTFYNNSTLSHFLLPATLRRMNDFSQSVSQLNDLLPDSDDYINVFRKNYSWLFESYIRQLFRRKLNKNEQELIDQISHLSVKDQVINMCRYLEIKDPELFQKCTIIHDQEERKDEDFNKIGTILDIISHMLSYNEYRDFAEYILVHYSAIITRDMEYWRTGQTEFDTIRQYIGGCLFGIWDKQIFPNGVMNAPAVETHEMPIGRVVNYDLSNKRLFFTFDKTFIPRDSESLKEFIKKYKSRLIDIQYLHLFLCVSSDSPIIKGGISYDNSKDSSARFVWTGGRIVFSISNFIFSLCASNPLVEYICEEIYGKWLSPEVCESLDQQTKDELNKSKIEYGLKQWREDHENHPILPFNNLEFMIKLHERLNREFASESINWSETDTAALQLKRYFEVIQEELEVLDKFYDNSKGYYAEVYKSCPLIVRLMGDKGRSTWLLKELTKMVELISKLEVETLTGEISNG